MPWGFSLRFHALRRHASFQPRLSLYKWFRASGSDSAGSIFLDSHIWLKLLLVVVAGLFWLFCQGSRFLCTAAIEFGLRSDDSIPNFGVVHLNTFFGSWVLIVTPYTQKVYTFFWCVLQTRVLALRQKQVVPPYLHVQTYAGVQGSDSFCDFQVRVKG